MVINPLSKVRLRVTVVSKAIVLAGWSVRVKHCPTLS